MNTKYLAIIAGIVLLGAAGFALVKSQYRRQNNASENPAENTYNTGTQPGAGFENAAAGTQPAAAGQISLAVNQPATGAVVSSAQILVAGRTVSNAEVSVNDQDTTADASGNFSVPITLDEGENTIIVVANDVSGSSTEQDLNVTYNAPESTN